MTFRAEVGALHVAAFVYFLMPLTGTGQLLRGHGVTAPEYCESDQFEPICQPNQVIVIKYARYGRMKLGRCLQDAFGYIDCEMDKLPYMDKMCSGRPRCQVKVSDLVGEGFPCKKDLRNYLEADYECVSVVVSPSKCPPFPIQVSAPSGYISNFNTAETGCGSKNSPWQIHVRPGQTINVTLLDFNADASASYDISTCRVLAVIRDQRYSETICSRDKRIRKVYSSKANQAEIIIHHMDTSFLLHYTAVGCPDIAVDSATTFIRTPGGAEIRCRKSGRIWPIRCVGHVWKGTYYNCSAGGGRGLEPGSVVDRSRISLPYGVSIALVAAVALVIGVIILVFGLIHLRRRRRHQREVIRRPPTQPGRKTVKDDTYSQHLSPYQQSATQFSPDNTMYGPCRGENTYYRTWETRGHFLGGQGQPMTPGSGGIGAHGQTPHASPASYPQPITPDEESDRYIEHIYESPKSVRREIAREPLQYYELESSGKEGSSKFSAPEKLK